MSVTVMTDVDGETLHLKVNGAGLALDTQTAYFVAHYLTFALNKLARDKALSRQVQLLKEAYGE